MIQNLMHVGLRSIPHIESAANRYESSIKQSYQVFLPWTMYSSGPSG